MIYPPIFFNWMYYRHATMASTRFRDDPARVVDQLRQSTSQCDYFINAPGNGLSPSYMADPHIRAQKWGANLMTNSVNVESDLMGIRQTNRDCLGKDEYTRFAATTQSVQYPVNSILYTDQSRATNPAWELRDVEAKTHGAPTHLDPQENIFLPFHNNLSTRILEKDNFELSKLTIGSSTTLGLSDLMPHHNLQTNGSRQ